MAPGEKAGELLRLGRLFLKLGVIGFGGPAAHVALMRREVVQRRRWLSEQHFLDLLGATNLIPGPNSTEMAIHIGRERAGWQGLIVAGSAFIAPAMLIVLALAWGYVRYGSTPAAQNLLYGIEPVVIAIIVHALLHLTKIAVNSVVLGVIGAGLFVGYLLGMNELVLLAAGGAGALIVANRGRFFGRGTTAILVPLGLPLAFGAQADVELPRLFLLFLKFGAVVFGSGYVLLAFLRGDLVSDLGWLTNQELVDAVAIGQFTPGPVFTTATFIGYLLAGLPGALLATAAIFLPSFVFVATLNPLVPRIRRSPWAGAALDGVNVAALALMAGVTFQLGGVALVDPLTIALALATTLVLFRWELNPVWPVLFGALVGWAHWWLT